jgi:SAM-dependent methyltransferase
MRWLRKPAGDPLAVSMSGIKLGDRLLVLGVSDVPLATALAAKAGLTGRACVLDESDDLRTRAASTIEQEGVLVESFCAPLVSLPFDDESFDVVVLRNVLRAADPASRPHALAEVHRVVRPGGRCIVIDDAPRSGIGALVGGHRTEGQYAGGGAAALLAAAGFRAARTLAERDGLVFVEGVKPNPES